MLDPIAAYGAVVWNPPNDLRTMTLRDHAELPDGRYLFVDAYCTDLDCDCRVAYLFIIRESTDESLAAITFGWQSLDFYRRWARLEKADDVIRDLKGPALMPMAPQSQYAPLLLELVTEHLKDPDYVRTLKKHYWEFRRVLAAKT